MRGKIRLTKEDKEWAIKVKDRDNNHCVICPNTERLNAHHLIPRNFLKYKHLVDNGISLCPKHHRFSRELSAHQNPIAFIKWLMINRPKLYLLAISRC